MTDNLTRRRLLAASSSTLAAGAVLLGLGNRALGGEPATTVSLPAIGGKDWLEPGQPGRDYRPVIVRTAASCRGR